MKHLLLILICSAWWFPPIAYAGTNKELPELDPSKPIYQKAWGGTVIAWPVGNINQVRLPEPKTVKELQEQLKMQDLRHAQEMKEQRAENKNRDHRFGSWMKRLGWLGLAIGFAAHFITALPFLKSMASSIATLAFGCVICGLGLQKTVEYDAILTLLGIGAGIILCYRYRNKSLSHLPWIQKILVRAGFMSAST